MSSLYRTHRPTAFSQVIGQDHLRSAIENTLKKGLVGHAYLFSGPRGTGKTTMARLFARAVNCQNPTDGFEPCEKCEMCLLFANNQAVDVIEIDAASNRGIDEIRDLREKIAFAPTLAKYKVYIIDEVHMLTKEAFNALLKTLEEPPAHVIFILATTELHKVPETIISRCQRYQFHRASLQAITEVLATTAKKEKIKADKEVLELIARRAEGSFRDALTLLGNLSGQDELTVEVVRSLIGLPKSETILALEEAITSGDEEKVKEILATALSDGQDITVLVKNVTEVLKEKLLGTQSEGLEKTAGLLEDLISALARSRISADPTALLIARVIQLTISSRSSLPKPLSTASVPVDLKPVETVSVVEEAPAASPVTVADLQKIEKPAPETPVAVDAVTESPKMPTQSNDFWSAFLAEIKNHNHAIYAVVRAAQLANLTTDKLIIAVQFRFYADRLNEIKNRRLIEKIGGEIAGRPLVLECVVRGDMAPAQTGSEDLMAAVVDVFELGDSNSE